MPSQTDLNFSYISVSRNRLSSANLDRSELELLAGITTTTDLLCNFLSEIVVTRRRFIEKVARENFVLGRNLNKPLPQSLIRCVQASNSASQRLEVSIWIIPGVYHTEL
jgi:hypothetical protein